MPNELKCSGYINGVKVSDAALASIKSAETPTREDVYDAMITMHRLEENAAAARDLRYGTPKD